MFCAIWVCGPAAGPNGVEARRSRKATERSRPGWASTNRCAGRSNTDRLVSSSRNMRPIRASKGTGASWTMARVTRGVGKGGVLLPACGEKSLPPARPWRAAPDEGLRQRSNVGAAPHPGPLPASGARGPRRRARHPPAPRSTPDSTAAVGSAGAAPGEEPARPAEPVAEAGMPVWARTRSSARSIAASSATTASPSDLAHRLDDLPPVVGLVVENAMGEAHGNAVPWPHEARAVARRVAERLPVEPLPGARQRGAAFGLHRDEARRAAAANPAAAAIANPCASALASAPPPTWTARASIAAPSAASVSAISKASVRAPSTARPLSGPCTPNGIAPRATARRAARTQGSPLSPGRRRQTSTLAPRSRSRRTTLCSASAGMKTSIGQSAARATTAAASAALPQDAIARRRARRSSPSGQAGDLQDAQIEHHAHQVARLVRARDVPRLVLDP